MAAVLCVRNLFKYYGEIKAVDDLSFTVNSGEIYGLLGPNGSGKSTTIRILLSLIREDSGTITLFNESRSAGNYRLRRKIGALVERPDFYNYLSAWENMKILANLSGIKNPKQVILEKIQWLGITEYMHRKVGTFSQGMKQRLGIAQSLINDPELIILDEPANGLDPQGVVEIRNILRDLAKNKGITIILSSHILNEIELIADRMVLMHHGKAILEGKITELLSANVHEVRISVRNVAGAIDILNKSGFTELKQKGNEVLIVRTDRFNSAYINKILINAGIDVDSVIPVNSLEDIFLQLTNDDLDNLTH